jgi:methylmalonyl-CoA/ethylmalonyl-CoA epimerase
VYDKQATFGDGNDPLDYQCIIMLLLSLLVTKCLKVMKLLPFILACLILISCGKQNSKFPNHFKHVDQMLWVVEDLGNTINTWKNLGFKQVNLMDTVTAEMKTSGKTGKIKLAIANLGGANVTWIQPLGNESVFSKFHRSYGDGAMSLVHRLKSKKALEREISRLSGLGLKVKEEIRIITKQGDLYYVLMDTRERGKYYLGYTYGDEGLKMRQALSSENLHNLQISQYAFAILDPDPVSRYWHKIGQPEFQMSDPVLWNTQYYGRLVDYKLIQGWQRGLDIDYEWCIPLTPPIVYDDHIKKHGEGIHHLAFAVKDMDKVLQDYTAKGFVISMSGAWGEEGKPGSGRYEYIDLENGGGLTMELLWNFEE